MSQISQILTVNLFEHPVTSVSEDYNVTLTDRFIGVSDNSTARTITLPSGADTGQIFTVKDTAGTAESANNITIDTQGSELIDGQSTASIVYDYQSLSFFFDGTNYWIF